jgi:hypothetical protein
MWTYNSRTGLISHNGDKIGMGYSGNGNGLDNPALESVHGIGPIPVGHWLITEWVDNYPTKGPVVAILAPVEHGAHGRTGFLIHGDNQEMNHTASHGCIIAQRWIRQQWRASGDNKLEVVAL